MHERWESDPSDGFEVEDIDPNDVEAQEAVRQIEAREQAEQQKQATPRFPAPDYPALHPTK